MEAIVAGSAILTVMIIIVSTVCMIAGFAAAIAGVIYLIRRNTQQTKAMAVSALEREV